MLVTVGMGENGVFDVLFLLEKCVTPIFARRVLPIATSQKLTALSKVLKKLKQEHFATE